MDELTQKLVDEIISNENPLEDNKEIIHDLTNIGQIDLHEIKEARRLERLQKLLLTLKYLEEFNKISPIIKRWRTIFLIEIPKWRNRYFDCLKNLDIPSHEFAKNPVVFKRYEDILITKQKIEKFEEIYNYIKSQLKDMKCHPIDKSSMIRDFPQRT